MTATRRAAPLALLLTVAGCASDPAATPTEVPVVQLGAPGEGNQELTDREVAQLYSETPGHTDADVAFVQGMIAHHQQALLMTAMVDERSDGTELPKLAERIEVSQVDEIALLEQWLEDRDEDLPDAHAQHDGGEAGAMMPGMLTDAELAQLESATGARFDELFLRYMIRHHEGAVLMVEHLLTEGLGGQESQVFQLAQHIESDQLVEISRMKSMLPPAD